MPICGNNYSAMGNYLIVADSGSRPTGGARYTGLRIFQLDVTSEYLWDGAGWVLMSEPTRSYTPTLSGVVGGTPTLTGTYKRSDGWCDVAATVTFGTTPSTIASIQISLPFTATNVKFGQFGVGLTDNAATNYPGTSERNATVQVVLYGLTVNGTYATPAGPSLTIPFTWGAADFGDMSGRFQMASRYS